MTKLFIGIAVILAIPFAQNVLMNQEAAREKAPSHRPDQSLCINDPAITGTGQFGDAVTCGEVCSIVCRSLRRAQQ